MTVSNTSSRYGVIGFWVVATLVGLVLRVLLLPPAPKYTYEADHDDFVRWGIQMTDDGFCSLYAHPPAKRDMESWQNGKPYKRQREYDRLCNYAPLSGYLLYVSGWVFKWVSADRLINTVTSRAIFESWSIMADFLLAWGCASLVARFRPGWAGRWTYLIVLLAPPIWWDSTIWGQMDSVILAPLVWMVRFIVDGRWVLAGVLFGLAAGIKAQAVLFLPMWVLVILCTRPFYKPLLSLAVGALVLLVVSLPFTLTTGLTWWRTSYVENLTEAYGASTTLMACNIWYLDLLITDSDAAKATWLGSTKEAWGKVFLLTGLGVTFIWMLWRWRRDPRAYVVYTGLSLLAFVMLPTRVHERYIVLALPWLIVMAMLWIRFWPGVVLLVAVATFQVTWPVWRTVRPGGSPMIERMAAQQYRKTVASLPPEQRSKIVSESAYIKKHLDQYWALRKKTIAYEWLFTCLALAGTAATVTAFFATRSQTETVPVLAHVPKEHVAARAGRQKGKRKEKKT